jgi:hypothetical protein
MQKKRPMELKMSHGAKSPLPHNRPGYAAWSGRLIKG